MLWTRELDSTIYTDLLNNKKYSVDFLSLNLKKNMSLSELARLEGNKKYSHNDIKGAMVLYNKSICFAETNSENLRLAYANRSMCFLKMNLYDECLADIGLAEGIGCPGPTLKKLQCRKEKCIQMVELRSHSTAYEPQSTFETNDLEPYTSSALKIEHSQQYGRMFTCANDINIGETILVEETYLHVTRVFDFQECSNCTKQQMNLIPCEGCGNAMFCSGECKKNFIHDFECDMVLPKERCCDDLWLPFILRSIVIAINTFYSIHEMMEVVANWLKTDSIECKPSTSLKSKYEFFFKLSTGKAQVKYEKSAYIIFNAIMKSKKLAVKFPTISEQRFLIHLIIHHCFIIQINSFGGSTTDVGVTTLDESTRNNNITYKHSIDLMTSYFNHSCIPNVVRLEKQNFTVIKTIAPIRKGDQLFITYLEAFTMDVYERRCHLESIYGFECNCELCRYGILKVNGLQDETTFLYIECSLKKVFADSVDMCLIRDIKKHCIDFLLKFPNFKTSRETAFVTENLCEMLRRELIGR